MYIKTVFAKTLQIKWNGLGNQLFLFGTVLTRYHTPRRSGAYAL